MKNIKISVVILNWNGINLLKEYFHSILNQSFKDYEIIFFDNNSVDESIDYVKNLKNNKIKIIKNKKNDGTAKASNLAAKKASGKYIFFISNDMLFDKNILKNLFNYMQENQEVGVSTVKMLRHINGKKSNIIDSMGAKIDLLCCANSNYIHENVKRVRDINKNIFFAFGGAIFIRKNIFKKIRGYDERFFTLTDDIDLCWRVQLLGYSIKYINKSVIYHKVSGTLAKSHNRHIKRFFSERNNLCSIIKNYSLISLLLIIPLYIFFLIIETIFFILLLNFKMSFVPFKSLVWNIKNINNTLAKRKNIQRLRRISDIKIFKNINIFPTKIKYGIEFLFFKKNWKNYLN
jgi:GT2 family glycosyltransferase